MTSDITYRIARRFTAKEETLVSDFKKALQSYQQGLVEEMAAFIAYVMEIILPDGKPPAWFHALGTGKQTTIKLLYHEGKHQLKAISLNASRLTDPKWVAYTVAELEKWGKKLRVLEIATQAGDEDRVVKQGGFTIIPMPGVKQSETEGAIEALMEAAAKMRAKFPQVVYGTVYLSTHLAAKRGAHYVSGDDSVHLSVRIQRRVSTTFSLIHEFGHRYDKKFLPNPVREEFWALSTRRENPLSVSTYGTTSPSENFAEAFAHYVLGMKMPPELFEIIDQLK